MKPDKELMQLYQTYIDDQSAQLPPFVFGNPVQRIAEMDIPDSIVQKQAIQQGIAFITLGRISGEFADWLAGQEGGNAVADILSGKLNYWNPEVQRMSLSKFRNHTCVNMMKNPTVGNSLKDYIVIVRLILIVHIAKIVPEVNANNIYSNTIYYIYYL